MMIYLNVVIVFGYVVLTAMLFDHGTKAREPLIRRLKFATLAVAFMCFGIGRMSYTPGTIGPDEWIFNMGHVAFQTFGAVYFWTGYRMAHGETREGLAKNERQKVKALASLVKRELSETGERR